MNTETIRDYGYIVNLSFPPMSYTPQNLRDLVNDILARYNLTTVNYTTSQDEVILSSAQGQVGELSRVGFFKNRVFLEKGPIQGGTIDSFTRVIDDVLNLAINRLRLQVFIQSNVIRIIANPTGINDARQFIGFRVCGFTNDGLRAFNRPVHAVGLRWYFPPTRADQPEYDVKIETLLRDASLIFLENVGNFQQPIPAQERARIIDNIRATRQFLTSEIANFLVQYNQQA